jgi:hypothetical protein
MSIVLLVINAMQITTLNSALLSWVSLIVFSQLKSDIIFIVFGLLYNLGSDDMMNL